MELASALRPRKAYSSKRSATQPNAREATSTTDSVGNMVDASSIGFQYRKHTLIKLTEDNYLD